MHEIFLHMGQIGIFHPYAVVYQNHLELLFNSFLNIYLDFIFYFQYTITITEESFALIIIALEAQK